MDFAGAGFPDPHESLTNDPPGVINAPALSPEEEQEKWLAESLYAAQEAALLMHRAMEKNNYADVLRAASTMLTELGTDILIPQNYYELYLSICDELHELGLYLVQQHEQYSKPYEQMYEEVQYLGPILPRLYLLMLVGSLYMTSGQAPALAIARDLIEMCKGVQHPTRGLFLRHFFLTMTRGRLPGDDSGLRPAPREGDSEVVDNKTTMPTSSTEEGGTVLDTAALLLQNLREMYWLWLRMKIHTGHRRQKTSSPTTTAATTTAGAVTGISESGSTSVGPLSSARRARRNRSELRVLVGMNIVRLSQLDGIDVREYRERLLPRLLTILLRHNDTMAQQYLFEVIVQVFPDDYHLDTLDLLLDALLRLAGEGDVCGTLRALTNRITKYVLSTRTEHTIQDTQADDKDEDVDVEDERAAGERKEKATSESKKVETHTNVLDAFLSKFEQVPVAYAVRHRADRPLFSTPSTSNSNSCHPVRQPTLLLAAYVEILTCITTMAIEIDADARRRRGHLERILSAVAQRYEERRTQQQQQGQNTSNSSGQLVTDVSAAALSATLDLINVTLDHMDSLHALLEMESFRRLLALLPFAERHSVGLRVCAFALGLPTTTTTTSTTSEEEEEKKMMQCNRLCSLAHAARFFELIDALLYERPGRSNSSSSSSRNNRNDDEETSLSDKVLADEQTTVCRVLLYILPSASEPSGIALRLKMVSGVRRLLLQGGVRRMRHTLPTLVTLYLQTIDAIQRHYTSNGNTGITQDATAHTESTTESPRTDMLQQIFQHLYSADGSGVIEVMSVVDGLTAFQLSLMCASRADTCGMPNTCYDFYVHAFTLYQHYAALRQDETTMLTSLVNALYLVQQMPEAQYDILATKTCQYTTRLLHRQDQSRLLALAAVLFDKPQLSQENQRRVHDCLQRAVSLARYVALPHRLGLYVDLLNIHLRFFEKNITDSNSDDVRRVEVKEVQELLERIAECGGISQQRVAAMAEISSEKPKEEHVDAETNSTKVVVRTKSVGLWCSDGTHNVDSVQRVYRDTLAYLRRQQQQDTKEENSGTTDKSQWRLLQLPE